MNHNFLKIDNLFIFFQNFLSFSLFFLLFTHRRGNRHVREVKSTLDKAYMCYSAPPVTMVHPSTACMPLRLETSTAEIEPTSVQALWCTPVQIG
jgi:hypothetical protein